MASIFSRIVAGEIPCYKVAEDENGEEVLFDIEDDEEWEKVADAYDAFADEEYRED